METGDTVDDRESYPHTPTFTRPRLVDTIEFFEKKWKLCFRHSLSCVGTFEDEIFFFDPKRKG